MTKPKGESQRIYWQQWLSSSNSNKPSQSQQGQSNGGANYSRRELITSSAAIRINPDAAKAKDVTQLLRDTLKLSSLENGNETVVDSLVLVGTLYSLPKDYIQFEHEPPPPRSSTDNTTTTTTVESTSSSSSLPKSSDPFHVIKTLKPDDNPLATRDKMMEHLQRIHDQAPSHHSSTKIAPKVQWYFVPSSGSSNNSNGAGDKSRSPIPSCIELDGYCTTMEEDDSSQDDGEEEEGESHIHGVELNNHDDADETNTRKGGTYYDLDLLLSRSPFMAETTSPKDGNGTSPCKQAKQAKELRRYFQLCYVQPSCSGYLLKQSSSDPHVWRRVYCTLTDDQFWYTTRVPYAPQNAAPPTAAHYNDIPRKGKHHGRISLGRALLLERNTEYTASPLYRVPHSFEVVNARGTSHVFRATTRALQQQWIRALTTKIMESFENSLLEHAELIVADETMARNRRFSSVAVDPLCEQQQQQQQQQSSASIDLIPSRSIDAETSDGNNQSMYLSLIQASVLRLGMDIAEYRELCRHVQALLSAKQTIVIRTSENGSSLPPHHHEHKNGSTPQSGDNMDATVLQQVQVAWDAATRLLDKATHVALEVQQYAHHQKYDSQHHQLSLSHSLETHCRHIDYVLTGQHRPNRAASPTNTGGRVDPQAPPPLDLFDFLLTELQGLARTTKP